MSDNMSDAELQQHVLKRLALYNLPIEREPEDEEESEGEELEERTPPFQADSEGELIRKLCFPAGVTPRRAHSAISKLIPAQVRRSRNQVGGLNGSKTPIVLFLTEQPVPPCVMTARNIADKDGLVRLP